MTKYFEAGDTCFKAHRCWYLLVIRRCAWFLHTNSLSILNKNPNEYLMKQKLWLASGFMMLAKGPETPQQLPKSQLATSFEGRVREKKHTSILVTVQTSDSFSCWIPTTKKHRFTLHFLVALKVHFFHLHGKNIPSRTQRRSPRHSIRACHGLGRILGTCVSKPASPAGTGWAVTHHQPVLSLR